MADIERGSLVVDRRFLPALRLVSDEGRLSILEAVTNSPVQPVRLLGVRKKLQIPPSSFLKYSEELARCRLMGLPQKGWGEKTPYGVATLEVLAGMSSKRIAEIALINIESILRASDFSSEAIRREIQRARAITEEYEDPYIFYVNSLI